MLTADHLYQPREYNVVNYNVSCIQRRTSRVKQLSSLLLFSMSHSHPLRAVQLQKYGKLLWRLRRRKIFKEATTSPVGGTQKKAVHLIYKPSPPGRKRIRAWFEAALRLNRDSISRWRDVRTFKHWICVGFPCGMPKAGCWPLARLERRNSLHDDSCAVVVDHEILSFSASPSLPHPFSFSLSLFPRSRDNLTMNIPPAEKS